MKWWTFLVILVIVISLVNARGGRGGGSRGGSRGGYRGGSSRSSRSYRSAFSGNRLSSSSSIRSALLLGTVYGASRYRHRARYRSDGTLPVVCYNDKYNMSTNGTVSYKGRFFCPLDENMSEDHRYCCGEEGLQYCCKYWDVPGHIAGVVIGVLAFAALLFVGVFCVIRRHSRRRRTPSSSSMQTPAKNDYPPAYQPPAYEMYNTQADDKQPYPPSTGYTYAAENNGYTPSPPYPTTDNNGYTPSPPYPTTDNNGYTPSPPYPTPSAPDNTWGTKY